MSALDVLAVAGCRPNFVKLAPLFGAMARRGEIRPRLVHTGQHYDAAMSDVFFRDLGLPAPDVLLEVGSGAQGAQTARALEALEGVMLERRPDLVLVVGDVNSTVAATLAAAKLGLPVAHVEAGLRSFDREMPEEINRIVTDSLADFLFATEASAVENLRREGAAPERVFLVGNVMADALVASRAAIAASDAVERHGLARGDYAVLTLHRPENVDDPEIAAGLVAALERIQRRLPLLFPAHPRTRERFARHGLWQRLESAPGVRLTGPLGYIEFLRLVEGAALVLTDSGGLQEESTLLGVRCLTLRDGTERPATVLEGTNRVVGRDPEVVVAAAEHALARGAPPRRVPPLWEGRAAERIVATLVEHREQIHELHRGLRERVTCGRGLSSAA